MKITILGDLKRFAPGHAEDFDLDLGPGATVDTLLQELGLASEPGTIILVNGRQARDGQPLSPSDHVTLLSAVEGG